MHLEWEGKAYIFLYLSDKSGAAILCSLCGSKSYEIQRESGMHKTKYLHEVMMCRVSPRDFLVPFYLGSILHLDTCRLNLIIQKEKGMLWHQKASKIKLSF